jgi:hypothetical protein
VIHEVTHFQFFVAVTPGTERFLSDLCIFRTGERGYSVSHSVHTGPETHPASNSNGTGSSFSGGQSGREVKLTTHIHLHGVRLATTVTIRLLYQPQMMIMIVEQLVECELAG